MWLQPALEGEAPIWETKAILGRPAAPLGARPVGRGWPALGAAPGMAPSGAGDVCSVQLWPKVGGRRFPRGEAQVGEHGVQQRRRPVRRRVPEERGDGRVQPRQQQRLDTCGGVLRRGAVERAECVLQLPRWSKGGGMGDLWRRLARAPEAVARCPVAEPNSGSAEFSRVNGNVTVM